MRHGKRGVSAVKLFIVAISVVVLHAAPHASWARETSRSESEKCKQELRYEGNITEEGIAALLDAIEFDGGCLSIRSIGGSTPAGKRLGRVLQDRRWAVIVDGYCMSACALNVFTPAPRRRVLANSIVGFHTSDWGNRKVFRERASAAMQQFLDEQAAQERALLERAGVKLDVVVDTMAAIVPKCAGWLDQKRDDLKTSVVAHAVAVWTPSRDDMERFGINFEGFWPESPAALTEAMSVSLEGKRDITVRFERYSVTAQMDALAAELSKLPPCQGTVR